MACHLQSLSEEQAVYSDGFHPYALQVFDLTVIKPAKYSSSTVEFSRQNERKRVKITMDCLISSFLL